MIFSFLDYWVVVNRFNDGFAWSAVSALDYVTWYSSGLGRFKTNFDAIDSARSFLSNLK